MPKQWTFWTFELTLGAHFSGGPKLFLPCEEFLVFFEHFPLFSRNFRIRWETKTLVFLVVFPRLLSKKNKQRRTGNGIFRILIGSRPGKPNQRKGQNKSS